MTDSFNALEYLDYLRKRWLFALVALVSAGLIATVASLLLPKQYTATATLLIEPPGADPRTAAAVSSIYLESLKSFESFASSDSLFAKACAQFHLLDEKTPLEALKRRVLRVDKIKDTKVLQLSVTLPDPRQAQAVVQYLAEQTVALARDLANQEEEDFVSSAQQQVRTATRTLEQARTEALAAAAPEDTLERQVQSLQDRLTQAQTERVESNLALAESTARGDYDSAAASRAGVDSLSAEIATTQKELDAKAAQLTAFNSRKQATEDRRKGAEDDFTRAQKRADDLVSAASFRGERLKLVDPGVVPQTPSSPNLLLTLLSALALTGAGCLVWFTLQFGFLRQREQPARSGLRMAGGGVR